MFLAHTPVGYLSSKLLAKVVGADQRTTQLMLFWGMLASIIPDFDLFYFYLIDGRAHVHHSYWTHIPLFWCVVFIPLVAIAYVFSQKRLMLVFSVSFLNVMLHLVLDTMAGGILWLYPLVTKYYLLVVVPSVYDWWVMNFIFHWTFAVELLLLVYSLYVFSGARKKAQLI